MSNLTQIRSFQISEIQKWTYNTNTKDIYL